MLTKSLYSPSQLTSAIKLSLIAAVSTTALTVSTHVVAAEDNVERIEVTGSRIQRSDMETASPVTVIDAATIRSEGYTSVGELLQAQTSMAGAAEGASSNNGSGGIAKVDLRGMGPERTLVLLDGRRMVNSGAGADSSVDLNSIPVAMIARVEILKDGASAVYGSDAIAGVVNIITKKDFEGFQFDVTGGMTDKSDGENGDISALYGFNTDTGIIPLVRLIQNAKPSSNLIGIGQMQVTVRLLHKVGLLGINLMKMVIQNLMIKVI